MNYIGSKISILSFIDETIEDVLKKNNYKKKNICFCDLFSGTSSVGQYFKRKGYKIISNDIQSYSYIITNHFIKNNKKIKFTKLKEKNIEPFSYLNNLDYYKGFIYNNYSLGGTKGKEYERSYFKDTNAMKIDAIRIQIENWKKENLLSENEYDYLITCLLEAADKVANTASVYEAFLKKIKNSALKDLVIEPLEIITSTKNNIVYNEDANTLIKKIKGDILYLDPPYNTRKYDTNYHILETIALYDNPLIKGKTGVRADTSKRSRFCMKKEALNALEEIIKDANFKYILLSYNNEGIISTKDIENIMKKYGRYEKYTKRHKRFKADNNRNYTTNYTIEYIHCLIKDRSETTMDIKTTDIKKYIPAFTNFFEDGYKFEEFLKLYLEKIGLDEVSVTKRSKDGGIDLKAIRPGIGNFSTEDIVEYYIQAKRYKPNTTIPVTKIRELKGVMPIGSKGMFITTSKFSKPAISEACNDERKVILIDGKKLIESCMDNKIGFVFTPIFSEEKLEEFINKNTIKNEKMSKDKEKYLIVNKQITKNDIRAKILSIPGDIFKMIDNNKKIELLINNKKIDLNLVKDRKCFSGVTKIYKELGLITENNIYNPKMAIWKYLDNKIEVTII